MEPSKYLVRSRALRKRLCLKAGHNVSAAIASLWCNTFSSKLPIPEVQFASALNIEQLLLPFFEVINICLKLVFIISVADEIFWVRYSCVAGVNQLVHFRVLATGRSSRLYNSRD